MDKLASQEIDCFISNEDPVWGKSEISAITLIGSLKPLPGNETQRKERLPGTGLEMPIVKKYVEMMGGTIEVESELGKGTKFAVILQHRIADKIYYEKKTEPTSAVHSEQSLRSKHILLAEY